MTADEDARVQALVLEEARLLDQQRYDDWLALYADDCHYWVPVSPVQRSPLEGVSHFNDDRQVMMARIHRLQNPRSFGAEPPPRTCHVVTDIRVAHEDGAIIARSSQIMLEYRDRDGFEADQRMFGGQVTHRLRDTAQGLRIIEKRVDLINAEGSFNAMAAPL